MLAKFGLLGTAGFVLVVLVVMILAGWLLATAVWLIRKQTRRWRRGTGSTNVHATTVEGSHDGPVLSGFTWRDEDP
ncbi:hypothetical protein [Streptomyces sp. SID2888]|uniref:hypothetical protein n=1 Tax=Streptomyces sp. SID2888 TaxID=2690256 RepID=UPI001F3765D6|nr:hypothetical protein [Streptomyces sp. SID2888]